MLKRMLYPMLVCLALVAPVSLDTSSGNVRPVASVAHAEGDFGDLMCGMCTKSNGNATGACALCIVWRYFHYR